MSASEKELIMAKREGYVEGARDQEIIHRASLRCHEVDGAGWTQRATEKYLLPLEPVSPFHCSDCDRPELCDIIKRGTGPCGKNAGIAPAACEIIDAPQRGTVAFAQAAMQRLRDRRRGEEENDGAGENGGLLVTDDAPRPSKEEVTRAVQTIVGADYSNKRAYLDELLETSPEYFGLKPRKKRGFSPELLERIGRAIEDAGGWRTLLGVSAESEKWPLDPRCIP